jgi:hypothetical protein
MGRVKEIMTPGSESQVKWFVPSCSTTNVHIGCGCPIDENAQLRAKIAELTKELNRANNKVDLLTAQRILEGKKS